MDFIENAMNYNVFIKIFEPIRQDPLNGPFFEALNGLFLEGLGGGGGGRGWLLTPWEGPISPWVWPFGRPGPSLGSGGALWGPRVTLSSE